MRHRKQGNSTKEQSQNCPIGAQGVSPPNMPYWHIGYLELKEFEKGPMQEGHSDSPFCLPERKNDLSPVKGVLPASGEVHLC